MLAITGAAATAVTSARATAHKISAQRSGGRDAGRVGAAVAATSSRTVLAWGSNGSGELGDGTTTDSDTPVKVQLPAGTKVTQVRAGCLHTLALTSKGHVLAWGDNAEGQLGNGSTTSSDVPVRVELARGTKITAVRAGCRHSLALTSKGHVLAWGLNDNGELGNGTTTDSDTPVRVDLANGTKVTGISAGANFSLARTSKGHVLAWGLNHDGELGNGETADSDTPVRVQLPRSSKVKVLAGGAESSLALTTTGHLYSWGSNTDGQLGDGTTTDSDVPVRILRHAQSRGHVTSLSAGCSHSVALFSRGSVLAWGLNEFGQLGNGTTTSSDTPVAVKLAADTTVTAVSAACDNSMALTVKGHVLTWGINLAGQLGNGTTTDSSDTPVRVALPSGWRASAVGGGPGAGHILAIVHKKS